MADIKIQDVTVYELQEFINSKKDYANSYIDKIYEKKFDEADLCRYKINKEFEKVIDNFDLRTKDENKPLLDKLEKLIVQSRVLKMLKEMEQENPPTSSTDTDGEQGGL